MKEQTMDEDEFNDFMTMILDWLTNPDSKPDDLDDIADRFPETTPQQMRLVQYSVMINTAFAIFQDRNAAYGDAIRVGGLLGSTMEVIGCAARLHKLVLDVVPEGKISTLDYKRIMDTCYDLINYGVISGIMLGEGNIVGGF